jgi:hypothetical protein
MGAYRRALLGAEAGAIAAAALEGSFFLLDLIRLQPLATPVVLAGVLPGPSLFVLDLSSYSGIANAGWAAYQIGMLTVVHFVSFGVVGVAVSLLFDWRQPLEAKRLLLLATLCSLAFFGAVSVTGSVVALDSVGLLPILGTNVLAAAVLGGSLRLVATPVPKEVAQADGAA